jgi:hypothetical protein
MEQRWKNEETPFIPRFPGIAHMVYNTQTHEENKIQLEKFIEVTCIKMFLPFSSYKDHLPLEKEALYVRLSCYFKYSQPNAL